MKNYIVKKANSTRYKIGYFRPKNKFSGLSDVIFTYFIHVHPDKLVYQYFKFQLVNGKAVIRTEDIYVLKKSKSFRLFHVKNKGVVDSSIGGNVLDYLGKFGRRTKCIERRALSLTRKFLKSHNVKIDNKNNLSQLIKEACYPLLKEIKCKNINSDYSIHFKKPNIKSAIKSCFGYDSKKLVKMVCERIIKEDSTSIFQAGVILKGLIPLDYFYTIESMSNRILSHRIGKINRIRNLLKNYDFKRIKTLLFPDGVFDIDYNINDSAMQYSLYKDKITLPPKPKDVQELHDSISLQVRNFKDPDFILPVKEELDGQTFGEFKIISPKSRNELVKWGNFMGNCIAGYAEKVKNKQCLLLGLEKNGQLMYNCEIVGKTLTQFRGKWNGAPEINDKIKVIKELKRLKAIN